KVRSRDYLERDFVLFIHADKLDEPIFRRAPSTQGARIEQAKRTLAMLIRTFPTKKTTFNIFNFGHDCHGIKYNPQRSHGSQSWRYQNREPIESRCRLPTRKLATAMFILTHGDVDDMANRIIPSAQSLSASHNTRLEIHALGIGSGVSTQIRQDIALAGNGVCLSPVEAEDISVSCIRLLAAG
ncbi:hypothetical protein PQX77_017511, partial [Marasmius sp. AFHP31]